MCERKWSNLKIELHIRSFDGKMTEIVRPYAFTKEQLEQDAVVVLSEEGLLDYVLTVCRMSDDEIIIAEAMRSSDDVMNIDGYESQGVLIIHIGDVHKTPTRNISYDKGYWYEVSIS